MSHTPVERLKVNCKGIQIDTTFVSHSCKGNGVKFMNHSGIDPRTAISTAIAVLYGPGGFALSGASESEVQAVIEKCKRLANVYWNDALMNVSGVEHQADSLLDLESEPEAEEDEMF